MVVKDLKEKLPQAFMQFEWIENLGFLMYHLH